MSTVAAAVVARAVILRAVILRAVILRAVVASAVDAGEVARAAAGCVPFGWALDPAMMEWRVRSAIVDHGGPGQRDGAAGLRRRDVGRVG